jgi:hypothetical protein
MGKSGSAKQQVNEYLLSMHFGVAQGLDAITGIYVGERQAWSGNVTSETAIPLTNEYLFGGPKKEGGIRGIAYYLPGGPTQIMPAGLAGRRGLTSASSPAYRGLSSVYFVGSITPGLGYYWGATPYLPSVWIQGRRAPKGLNPDYAMVADQLAASFNGYVATVAGTTVTLADGHLTTIGTHSASLTVSASDGTKTIILDGTTIEIQPFTTDDDGNQHSGTTAIVNGYDGVVENDYVTLNGVTVEVIGNTVSITMGNAGGTDANPSHIIFECLMNPIWGMGGVPALVDQDSFEAAAVTLYHEGFGLSMVWTKESSIEDFISEVLDHVQGALYVDPDTGKLTLKLFRDDYDVTTLPLITPDNAVLDSFQRKLWGETVNEIVVTWTNPSNEQDETVTQQDLGNIAMQGDVVSDSRNYYGVRTADLATRLGVRDVRQSSAPLASVEALLDRASWNLKPGSVLRVTWPEYDLENLIMRVVEIDYGKIGSPEITVSLLQDIFSLEDADFTSAPTTGFTGSAQPPSPMNHAKIITSPYFFSSRVLSAADAAAISYPEVMTAILGASSNTDASFFEIVDVSTLPTGQQVSEVRGTRSLLGYSLLPSPLGEEATSTIAAFGPITSGLGPNVAGFIFIGEDEASQEIALIESYDDGDGWHISRGVLDTIPRAWAADTPIWFYDVRTTLLDDQRYSDGESVNYKFLTVTSQGILDPSDAPIQGAVLSARPYMPNRPANVVVGGSPFGTVDLSASAPTSVDISWSNRNRLMEDTVVVRWADGTIAPEANQTTTVVLTSTSDGSVLSTTDGLTGTTYSLPSSAFGSEIQADVTLYSKRDGYRSFMGVTRRVRIKPDPSDPGSSPGNPAPPTGGGYTPPTTYPDPQNPPAYTGHGLRTAVP